MAAPPLLQPSPPNPLSIALPAQPNDPNLPAPPVFPLTLNDVLTAIKYCKNVDLSIGMQIIMFYVTFSLVLS